MFMKNSWEKAQEQAEQAGEAEEAARGCSGRVKQKAWPERGLIAKVRWKQKGE